MTFLLTDIEGSTRQWEQSQGMSELVVRHFAVLREAVDEMGGEVFATMGDGIAAAFTSADAALHAAIRAQREMPATGLVVRMGIHTGEAHRVDDDYRGRPVNRTARIMAAGHGGQILLSDVSATLVRTGPSPVTLLDLGTHRLRDLIEPERVWQVVEPGLGQSFPPVRGLDTYSNNLPAQRSSLVGRELDVERVTGLVREHRIVTLTGVGGVGKTRMAVQCAAELLSHFQQVWFVELASVADPDDVADAVALTLGAGAVNDSLAAAGALLAGDRTLLVVDNCEHVVESAAAMIDALTAECPNLSVIATSREPLDIVGEHVVVVRSLDTATTAVELFCQRAEAAGCEPASLDRALVEHICRRLDGIPLAIELAAARAATLGVSAIGDALDDRFSLLSGRRRAVDRHGTMRATIDWSYRLLSDDEQRLFEWLAVFSNGFELDAVQHVAGALGIDEGSATEVFVSLVHRSMVVPEQVATGVRYRLLETMRAFALEHLDERGDRMAAATAQAEWVTTLTDLPVEFPCSAAVERCSIRLEREADNWRDAVMLAARLRSPELAGRLCGPPVAYFLLGRHDLADCVRPLLDLTAGQPRHRRSVLVALIVSAAGATPPEVTQQWVDEVQALDEVDPSGVGGLMRWMSLAWRGDFVRSVEVCVEAARDPRISQGSRDMFVGIATIDRFSLTDAADDPHGLIERALEVADRSDVGIQRVTCLLGAAWGLAASQPDRSLQLVRRALADISNVPALTRLTLPGSASRLLAQLDPAVAAEGLLEQLDARPARRSFVDLIPLFYATALLHRVGHPSAGSAFATLSVSPAAPYLSMMDCVDLARRAAATGNLVSLGEMETMVRAGLDDLIGSAHEEVLAVGRC